MEPLILFVQKRGELGTRDEIIDKLWGKDVFVDVDRGINSVVRKIRTVLGDDPAQPHYLETLVKATASSARFAALVTKVRFPTNVARRSSFRSRVESGEGLLSAAILPEPGR